MIVVPATETLVQVKPLLPQVTGDGIEVWLSVSEKFWTVPPETFTVKV